MQAARILQNAATALTIVILPLAAAKASPETSCVLAAAKQLHGLPNVRVLRSRVAVIAPPKDAEPGDAYREVLLTFRAAGIVDEWRFVCLSAHGFTNVLRVAK